MMLVDVGRWIASMAAHWPDLSVDIEYYHKTIESSFYSTLVGLILRGTNITCDAHRHVENGIRWVLMGERGKRALTVAPRVTIGAGGEEYISYTTVGAYSILRALPGPLITHL